MRNFVKKHNWFLLRILIVVFLITEMLCMLETILILLFLLKKLIVELLIKKILCIFNK